MVPLTPPSGCVSCACLAVKITELEGRISTLYQIQEAEKFIDTITFSPAQTDTTCPQEPGATVPCQAADSAPPPVIVPDESPGQLYYIPPQAMRS